MAPQPPIRSTAITKKKKFNSPTNKKEGIQHLDTLSLCLELLLLVAAKKQKLFQIRLSLGCRP